MFHQPVLIYNPTAGKFRRNPGGFLHRTKAAFARGSGGENSSGDGSGFIAKGQLKLLPTTGPAMAGDLAREAIKQGADLILVLGGDGTVNEVLQGVAGSGVPLGVLPGGTANCLAIELGLGSRLERAAERLASCHPTSIALGRVTTMNGKGPSGSNHSPESSRWFLSMCGAGLDASIVDEVHGGLKRATGKLAYWVAGLAQFRKRVETMEVQIDGKSHTCGFALISNIRNYGGDMEIASGASLRHDHFEVVLFEGSSPLRYALYMMGVGLRQVQKMPGVKTLRATSARIVTNAPTQVDGELFGRKPLHIEIVPNALTLLLPPSYR